MRSYAAGLLIGFIGLCSAQALTVQEPIPGTYQCFSSSEGPFEENVQDIGASLEFPTAQTYRFTTNSATEEGTVSSSAMDTGNDAEAETALNALWQSGSNLVLQPSSGSASYQGVFFLDHLGHRYVVIQNNNGLHIRCESAGADIAATFDYAANRAGTTQTSSETVDERIPVLQPLDAVAAGSYQCHYSYASYDLDTQTIIAEPSFTIFTFQLFDSNEYECSSLNADVREPGDVDGCDDGDPGTGTFSYDAATGTFQWLGGSAEIWFSDLFTQYGQNQNGIPTFVIYNEEEGIYSGEIEHPNVYTCIREGDTTSVAASTQQSEDYQLAPADVKAPTPPAVAGGLSGLYINYDDSMGLNYTTSLDINGNITWTPSMTLSAPTFIYFLENGYVYEGLYPWSFAELDCSRLLKDYTPLCNTYIIKNDTIQFGNDEALPFTQTDDALQIGENINDAWLKQEPLAPDTRLEGIWEYVAAGGFGGTGVDTLTLRQNGTFEWQYSGTVSYSTPDSVSDATDVDVYVGGTSTEAKTGNYKIDGYTLELTRSDGTVEKVLFVLDYNENGTPGNIWLGGATRYLKQ